MDNKKIYQICHDLIYYFATLTSPKKSYLGPIFRTGGSNIYLFIFVRESNILMWEKQKQNDQILLFLWINVWIISHESSCT